MGKRGRSHQHRQAGANAHRATKRRSSLNDSLQSESLSDMDDEIDAFHKQRDIVPLDVNADAGGSGGDDDEFDDEQPVFDDKNIIGDEDEEEDEGDDDDDSGDYNVYDTGLAAKIVRQQKYLQQKFGGVNDEIQDDEEDDEQDKPIWGGKNRSYHGGEKLDSSDDEALEEEEAEILRMQEEKARRFQLEDFGMDVDGESDRELTLEEISVKGKDLGKAPATKGVLDGTVSSLEDVKKDLSTLSREEQMNVVFSSAPEIVGLLSDLNDAIEELDGKVNPLLSEVQKDALMFGGVKRFLEVKHVLLLAYCQSITFYFLLKSEGQPVRDHPVIARIVEIKGLLDKVRELDKNLPSELEELLEKNRGTNIVENLGEESAKPALGSKATRTDVEPSLFEEDVLLQREQHNTDTLVKPEPLRNVEGKEKRKNKNDQVGLQSKEMLRVRAELEEKLRQKGVFSCTAPKLNKAQKNMKPLNRQLETYDDFNDDSVDVGKGSRQLHDGRTNSKKLSDLVALQHNRQQTVSGDYDLPNRDDIGERRRKHEVRVLASAGVRSENDAGNEREFSDVEEASDMEADGHGTEDSEDDLYNHVKRNRDAKLAAKAEIYKRKQAFTAEPETVDGKRQASYQIMKNRGLTRQRKKSDKNPRKKYRNKAETREKRRQGQVRSIKKPHGPYGGEASGINPGVSRSIRFGK